MSADVIAYRWAEDAGARRVVYLADWSKLKRAAGPIRNQRMVDENRDAYMGFAFILTDRECRGTRDCMRRMDRAGIPVRVIEATGSRNP